MSEWYSEGLRFSCTQCGNCCTGPPGAVWFTADEGRAIAARLGLDEADFYRRYARKIDGRWSLTERQTDHGYDCIFLHRTSGDQGRTSSGAEPASGLAKAPGKALCSIYEVRPAQCRTWPFWPENLRTKRDWETVKRVTPCPGMNSGRLHTLQQIRVLAPGQ